MLLISYDGVQRYILKTGAYVVVVVVVVMVVVVVAVVLVLVGSCGA